jgi:hypothetical protein
VFDPAADGRRGLRLDACDFPRSLAAATELRILDADGMPLPDGKTPLGL